MYHFKKISSTNEKAKELAKKGLFDIVVLSDEQTRGIGRFNRKWISDSGGLFFSMLLNVKDIDKAKYLTFISALSVVKSIDTKSFIKWPNDIYLNRKKLCGILTETISGKKNYVIIGVGININQLKFSSNIKDNATSLRIESGKKINKKKILDNFLKNFRSYYYKYKKKEFEGILEETKKKCNTIGEYVKVRSINGIYSGKVIDIDKDCNLVLKLKNNKVKKITDGDIFSKVF